MRVSGPMFEQAISGVWQSVHHKEGAHYNIYGCQEKDGMTGLHDLFPDGEANDLNFVLFSTSGVHGMYTTIEEAETQWRSGEPSYPPSVTFLVVQPRICCLRYGNCLPNSEEDFTFLYRLRETSWKAVQTIGQPSS